MHVCMYIYIYMCIYIYIYINAGQKIIGIAAKLKMIKHPTGKTSKTSKITKIVVDSILGIQRG